MAQPGGFYNWRLSCVNWQCVLSRGMGRAGKVNAIMWRKWQLK